MRWISLIFIVITACNQQPTAPLKITFGSCSDQDRAQQLWKEIADEGSDLLILSGDNIYADNYSKEQMEAAYSIHKSNPDYQRIINTSTIFGIWDDHDYGANDAGINNVRKDLAKEAMLKFFDVSDEANVRNQKGAYQAHSFKANDVSAKVILLDTRYFRDTLVSDTTSNHRYFPNEEGDILGEEQWSWLEKELQDDQHDVMIVVSSIQFIAEEHFYEKWSLFPKAKNRFIELVKKLQPKNMVMISGDRHIAEVSKLNIEGYNQPLYDITSSGLSHTWSSPSVEENKYRVGDLIIERNYGLMEVSKSAEKLNLKLMIKGENANTLLSQQLAL